MANVVTNPEKDLLINKLVKYPTVNYNFLASLTDDQLKIVRDLEKTAGENEKTAQAIAQYVLARYSWPNALNSKFMNYSIFNQHYANGCSGDVAFYYYIFDKCIPRRKRNSNKFFMDRLATFSMASFRELWEETQVWTINGCKAILKPNKESSKKGVLLPDDGEFAADHIIEYNGMTAEVEEKPCLSVLGAIKKYMDPKTRYYANYLMLFLERYDGTYSPGFYLHNYTTNKTFPMIPENSFPGYPKELVN